MLTKRIKVFISHSIDMLEDDYKAMKNRIVDKIANTELKCKDETVKNKLIMNDYDLSIMDTYHIESNSDKCPTASKLSQVLNLMAEADIIIISKEAITNSDAFSCSVMSTITDLQPITTSERGSAFVIREDDNFQENIGIAISKIVSIAEIGDILLNKRANCSYKDADIKDLAIVVSKLENGVVILSKHWRLDNSIGHKLINYVEEFLSYEELNKNYTVVSTNHYVTYEYERFQMEFKSVIG